jgi:hypothetical protein
MADMKFVVLIWAVFQMLSFTASDTNSTTTESYTLINSTNLAKRGCDSRCGDLIVPYPFGIGNNSECYINEGFRIYCNTSLNPPKATIDAVFYNGTDVIYKRSYNSIKSISDSTIRLSNQLASKCCSPNGTIDYIPMGMRFDTRPYSLSKVNKFTAIGCDGSAFLLKMFKLSRILSYGDSSSGCMVFCSAVVAPGEFSVAGEFPVAGECTGNGCCQSPIAHGITSYKILLDNSSLYDDFVCKGIFNPCTYAFVGEENVFKFKGVADLNDTNFIERIEATVPIVLEWAIGNLSCSEAKATDGYACKSNSICVNSTSPRGGYRCKCKEGYEGNPYLPPGCQGTINKQKLYHCLITLSNLYLKIKNRVNYTLRSSWCTIFHVESFFSK